MAVVPMNLFSYQVTVPKIISNSVPSDDECIGGTEGGMAGKYCSDLLLDSE